MSLNIKEFKRPSNIIGVASFDPMYDRYTIALRWEWAGMQQGYNRVIDGKALYNNAKFNLIEQTCTLMIDEICAGADWNGNQEKYFRNQASLVLHNICKAIDAGKTNIKVKEGEVKWATGNKTAQKLKYSTEHPPMKVGVATTDNHVSEMARHLPGVMTKVEPPKWCKTNIAKGADGCGSAPQAVYYLVQHLNDYHKLSREVIADWIDELHDAGKMNAEFKPWGEEDSQSTDECDTIEQEGTKLTPLYNGNFKAKDLKPGEVPDLEDIYNKSKELDPWPGKKDWKHIGWMPDDSLKLKYDFDNMTMDEIAAAVLDASENMTLSEFKNLNEQVNKFVDAAGLTTQQMHTLLKALKEEK